jgi:hypothetical protein
VKKILIAIVPMLLIAAGCGRNDVSIPIENGYEYSDSGGLEKLIVYRGNERTREIVVDARVDDYKIVDNKLLVARRPRESFLEKDNALSSRLLSTCEYWIIDLGTHQIQKAPTAAGVNCG